MPIYMDVHKGVEGLTAEAVIEAHKKDLETQGKHGVKYLKYWYSETEAGLWVDSDRRLTDDPQKAKLFLHGEVNYTGPLELRHPNWGGHTMRHIWLFIATLSVAITLTACGGGSAVDPLEVGDPERGRDIFETGGGILSTNSCSGCHSLDGSEAPPGHTHGPTLQGISERAGERVSGMSTVDYLRQSILDPYAYKVEGFSDNKMPDGFKNILSEEDIDNLVAFLLTQ